MIKPQIVNAIPNVESFLRHCQRQEYRSKSVIISQGEDSNSLYLILDGSVSVMVEDEVDKEVRELNREPKQKKRNKWQTRRKKRWKRRKKRRKWRSRLTRRQTNEAAW